MARYELIERVGVGGMAEIFRGRAIAGGGFEKPVAIKRILPHLSQDKRFVELLITEAKTLSQLRHRNVVQIYDVGLGDDGQYFLVMEFVDGVDLGALYEALAPTGRRLPLEISLYVAGEVCEALDHAHRARDASGHGLGLVHRDVTPSNILLSRSGEVKLTDFGIAKRMEEATGHGGVRGKFAYISPEQAINAHVDARSDVYSVGIVLYELALGRRLYSHLADFDALRAVREARPPRLTDREPQLDRLLAGLLDTALAPDPAGRFPSAGAFGAALRGYRYSLSSEIGDPATELARMIDAHRRGRIDEVAAAPPSGELTVVRIATAAGFSAGLSDDGERGAADGFDDEQTHALAPARPAHPTARAPVFDDSDGETSTGSGLLGLGESLADAETRIMASAPAAALAGAFDRELESSPRIAPPRARISTPPPITPRPVRAPHDAVGDGEGRYERPPTPTLREVFYRGTLLDEPGAAAPPRLPAGEEPRMSRGRRRAILVASGACVLCAVAAFVVVGLLLDAKTSAPALAAAADAGLPPPDAAARAAPARSDAGATSERTRTPRRKKRPEARAPAKDTAAKKKKKRGGR